MVPRIAVFLNISPSNQRTNAGKRRRKPKSAGKKKRSCARARSANDSAPRTSSASNYSSSARKRRHGEPRSAAGNHCLSPSLPRRQRCPRVHGVAAVLRLLSLLHRLARPRVQKARRRLADRPGYLVVVAPRRAGVRVSRRRLGAVVLPHRRGRMRNSKRRLRTRMTGSRLRRTCGSLRDCGASSDCSLYVATRRPQKPLSQFERLVTSLASSRLPLFFLFSHTVGPVYSLLCMYFDL